MKIGFVLDDGLDKPDGVQTYILTLGNWFTRHGHEVRYLVGETKRTDIPHVYSMAKNVKVRFNGNALTIPLPASSSKIKKILDNEQFDVIHVQVPYSPFMGAKVVAQASTSTNIVGTFHILPYGFASSFGTRLLGMWLKSNLKRFSAMASVSAPAQKFAFSHFGVQSSVIPNSVEINSFKPPQPLVKSKHQFNVVFLGRLVERKGCRQLLEAMVILKNNYSLPRGFHLDICGDGMLREGLEQYVVDNQLTDCVTFHGFVSQEQKVSFLQQADVSVFPSTSGESFGIVLLEAMAAHGGIVLAGNNPGYESVLGTIDDSIIDARSPQKMARHFNDLFTDDSRRSKLFALQQAHVKQFDTAVVAKQLLKMYS